MTRFLHMSRKTNVLESPFDTDKRVYGRTNHSMPTVNLRHARA